MKINGIEVNGPNEEVLVLPRKNGDVVFRARALTSLDEFEALVPEPKAPGMRTKDGFSLNEKDPTYRQQKSIYDTKKLDYLIIASLEPSNIEWEKVDINKPGTWTCWRDELKEAGFNLIEIGRISTLVMQANCLDESKLEEARKCFLLGEAEELKESSSQSTEQPSTESGQPAKD